MNMNSTLSLLIVLTVVTLTGCLAAAVGAVGITSVDVIHDRRTVGAYVDDGAIEVKAKHYILTNEDLRKDTHINVTSMNGIVLLTGEAPTPALRDKMVTNIRQIEGVRQVVNEVTTAGKTAMMSRTNDTWLTAKVKTKLFEKTKLDANRVKVVSERGNVYLMGVMSRAEAQTATEAARQVGGIVRIVKVFEYTD
ncbi:MAG: BON domain-containing protein [Gammaproteobacteria bacterium]|nr:BON domain-containing protein [Gammaproteobacteria bacterium]